MSLPWFPPRRIGTFVVVAGVGVTSGTSFLATVMVPRLLPVSGAADFFIASSACTLGALLMRAGTDRSIVRMVSVARARQEWERVAALVRANICFALIVAAVAVPLLGLLLWPEVARHGYHSGPLEALPWVIAVWLVAEAIRLVVSEPLRGLNRLILATVLGNAGRGVAFVAVLGFLLLGHAGSLRAVCLGAAACSAVCAGGAAVASLKASKSALRAWNNAFHALGEILTTSGPFFVTALSAMAVSQGDILIGGFTLIRNDVAYYAAASKLALVIALPISALTLVIAAQVPALWAQGERVALEASVRRLAAVFALATLPVCIVFIVFSRETMSLVYPAGYSQGAGALTVLTVGSLCTLLTGPNGFVLLMTNDSKFVARATAGIATLQVAGMVMLALWIGPIGLALASSLGTVTLNLLFTWRVKAVTGMRTDVGLRPWRLVARGVNRQPLGRPAGRDSKP